MAATTKLDEVVPKYFVSPLGRKLPIDYTGEYPSIELRLQELFGQKSHPLVKNKPLLVTLLSPAGRPLQKTMDLPNFWKTSYLDIRKEMRGRYQNILGQKDLNTKNQLLRLSLSNKSLDKRSMGYLTELKYKPYGGLTGPHAVLFFADNACSTSSGDQAPAPTLSSVPTKLLT